MSIREYQQRVDRWIKEFGVRYFNELTNVALLNEEVGEFTGLVARIYGEQSFKNEKSLEAAQKEMSDELADILFVLACLSNQMGIDLETAIEKNFIKKTERDQTRHRTNLKLK